MCTSSLGALYIYKLLFCKLIGDTDWRKEPFFLIKPFFSMWWWHSEALRSLDHALLSLPFVCGASLGTVFTSAEGFFTSGSGALLFPSSTILPLGKERERESDREALSELKQSPSWVHFSGLGNLAQERTTHFTHFSWRQRWTITGLFMKRWTQTGWWDFDADDRDSHCEQTIARW